MTIEIYFEDLTPEKQKELKPYLEANINTDSPIAIFEIEEDEK